MVAKKVLGPRSSTNYPPPIHSDIREVKVERRYEVDKHELEKSYPLLDRLHEGVLVCGFDGKFHFANASAQDSLGYSFDELSSMGLKDIVAPGQMAELIRAIEEIRLMSTTTDIKRIRILSKGGAEKILAGRASLVVEGKEAFGVLAFIRDVTDFFRMQEELTEARALKAVGDASSKAAHDIRNLITPARILLSYLCENDIARMRDGELAMVRTQANVAAEAVDRVIKLTEEMLQLAVPGPKKTEQIAVNRMLFDVVMRVRAAKPEEMAKVSLKTAFSTKLPPVSGDKMQLERAVSNIIINGIDAMPSGGPMTISTEVSEAGMVVISVSDSGHGMPQEVLDSIFLPFFTTKGEKGTGLGLAIAAQTVKSHNGYINIESEVGKGTRFELHLPAME